MWCEYFPIQCNNCVSIDAVGIIKPSVFFLHCYYDKFVITTIVVTICCGKIKFKKIIVNSDWTSNYCEIAQKLREHVELCCFAVVVFDA